MLKSIFKFLLSSIILTLVVILSLFYFLPSILPEKDIKKAIESFGEQINSEIKISGKTSFTLLPSPSITIENFSIRNNDNLRNFDRLHVKLSLTSIAQQNLNFFIEIKNKNGHLAGDILIPKAQKAIESGSAKISIKLTQPTKLALTAKISGGASFIKLTDMKFLLTNTKAEGNFQSIRNGKIADINSNINFIHLDIDEVKKLLLIANIFKPDSEVIRAIDVPKNTEKPTIITAQKPNEWDNSPIDFSWINDLRINADINLQEIVSNGFDSGSAGINIDLKDDSILRITLKESSIYNGKGSGYFKINNSNDTPIISTKYVFNDVEVGNLIGDILNYRQINAKGGFSIETSSSGNSLDEIMKNLSGKGLISIENGKFMGFDSAKLADAENINRAFEDKEKTTDIIGFDASFMIKDGVLKNDDMKLQIPFSQLSGEGIIDLYNQSVNYTITPNIGISNIGLKVPLKIKGDIKNPKYKADIKGLIIKNVDQFELLDKKQIKKMMHNSSEMIQKIGKGFGVDLKAAFDKILPEKTETEPATTN